MRRTLHWSLFKLASAMTAISAELVYGVASLLRLVWPKANYLRWLVLGRVAKTRLALGLNGAAERLAEDQIRCAPAYRHDWNYGNTIHHSNILLGRIALRRGDVERAKELLLAAGLTPGSPQLDTFGPNMALARELLQRGGTDAVLTYLEECRGFWDQDFNRVDEWSQDIREGRTPQFGANLHY